VFVFKAPGPLSGEFNPFVMERVFHGSFDEVTCMDWSSDSRYASMIKTSLGHLCCLVMGWVGRMFKWDCSLLRNYTASAKVGPRVKWSFLGASKGSSGGILLQRFGNWFFLTVGSDSSVYMAIGFSCLSLCQYGVYIEIYLKFQIRLL
jgi:hypothetical protein